MKKIYNVYSKKENMLTFAHPVISLLQPFTPMEKETQMTKRRSKGVSTAHEPTLYPFTYNNRRPLLELVVALDKLSAAQGTGALGRFLRGWF